MTRTAQASLMLVVVCLCGVRTAGGDDSSRGFALRDGERVVLLGGTLIEREQQYGYWETQLTAACADQRVTFRNLGWSGDTVWGESRGLFEPHLGYERLVEQVQAVDPTLVLIAYGANEAFAGESGLARFVDQYGKLLGDLAGDGRRFVLLNPLLMEPARVPDDPRAAPGHVADHNRDVDQYAEAIRSLADEQGHRFIDLRPPQRAYQSEKNEPLTSNGLHLTEAGYRKTAAWLIDGLAPTDASKDVDFDTPAAIELREAIIAKNELFFHRWRPQNFTYLFGFRQHEQGQNAVEIPQFDPLIEQAERRIARLARSATASPVR